MNTRQLPVQVEDLNGKVLVFMGDEFDRSFLSGLRSQFKKKGIDVAAIITLPDSHYLMTQNKAETIELLKNIIIKLEETT
jgi:hypothetical protein